MSAIHSLRSISKPEESSPLRAETQPASTGKAKKTVTSKANSTTSLKEVSEKIPESKADSKTEKAPLSVRITQIMTQGADYMKEVRDRAVADKAKGVKPLEGSRAYWGEIVAKAESYARAGQNQIIDQFAKETGNLITNALTGSKTGTDLTSAVAGGATDDILAASAGKNTALTGAASTAGKVAGAVGAAYSVYQLWENKGKDGIAASAVNGATAGAYIGSMILPGLGTAIGGAIGAIGGAVLGYFGSKGKHPEHEARDKMRDILKEVGFLDKDYTVGLANGSRFSLNVDGKKKLTNIDGGSRFGYQFDPSNPLSGPAIGMLQPLAMVITGGDQKLATDLTGYLVNAATSDAKDLTHLRENVIAIYKQSKLDLEGVAEGVDALNQNGKISDHQVEAYAGGLMSVADLDVLKQISGEKAETPQDGVTIH
ncbi:MAG TPA: hypothetical protein PKA63_06040 [Oligoflexia bacterium]|nr:hypothetical protein [Oligoflexia bacterium]HMP48210.1 hypothetical protein [Oligoflexia bacterium]